MRERTKIRILVVGCGNMGASHARAYHKSDTFEIAGLVSRGVSKRILADEIGEYPLYDNFETALAETKPDAVCIATYPDTHADMAIKAMEAGCHVFVEKPLAVDMTEAQNVIDCAIRTGRKLQIGYILRHHPSWRQFIASARTLGTPLIMRMNLNQQSCGNAWNTHKSLIRTMSPIVDCGGHYVDVMCQMTDAIPLRVNAIAANVSDEIAKESFNYGQLQVTFSDGSVGWYEAGWGPMMSECAFFVKDVIGPRGAVTLENSRNADSDKVGGHTGVSSIHIHYSQLDDDGNYLKKDEFFDLPDSPEHHELCQFQQDYFRKVIQEDLSLEDHWRGILNSMKIVLAAEKSYLSGQTVYLTESEL